MNNKIKQAKIDGYNDAYITVIEAFFYGDTYDGANRMIDYMKNVAYATLERADEISYYDGVYYRTYLDTMQRLLPDIRYCHLCNIAPNGTLANLNTDIANNVYYFLFEIL